MCVRIRYNNSSIVEKCFVDEFVCNSQWGTISFYLIAAHLLLKCSSLFGRKLHWLFGVPLSLAAFWILFQARREFLHGKNLEVGTKI
jgi:hypothetical protein